MESCIIKSPLGFTKITGDDEGIQSVTVLNSEEKITDIIPIELEDCVIQLQEYFEGSRKQFQLKLNLQGTNFQKKVWEQLKQIPIRKNTIIPRTIKTIRRYKSH